MMIIAKLKSNLSIERSLEEMQMIQQTMKKGYEEGSLVYDSNYIDLIVITDKEKEEFHAL